jgi:hypothetical protein
MKHAVEESGIRDDLLLISRKPTINFQHDGAPVARVTSNIVHCNPAR